MKYLEIIPDFLSMYGVFTSQNTSQVRQEMSNSHTLFYVQIDLVSLCQDIKSIVRDWKVNSVSVK